MELSIRWSILQVVVIFVCYRGNVLSAERVQGCVESRLNLGCPEMKVIQISAVVLGDSSCTGTKCCITYSDCTHNANAGHTADVHRNCNDKQSCTVGVLKDRIPCGYWGVWYNNDFERVTYSCVDRPQESTTATFSMPDSTLHISYTKEDTPDAENTDEITPEKETESDSSTRDFSTFVDDATSSSNELNVRIVNARQENRMNEEQPDNNSWVVPVVIATVCLLALIAIVVAVAMMRRKRSPKDNVAIEMTDNISSGQNETMDSTENQTMISNNGSGSPIYSNNKIKKSRDAGAKVAGTYEVPNNAGLYSLGYAAGTGQKEDPNAVFGAESGEPVYLESRESAYQVPRPISSVYSVVKDVRDSDCAGSRVDAPNETSHIYGNVEPAKPPTSSTINAYDEARNWKESEYEAVKAGKATEMKKRKKKKKTDISAQKRATNLYINVDKPLKNAATFSDSKPDFPGRVEANDKVSKGDGVPNPIYVTMSLGIQPENIYANQASLSPSVSVTARALLTEGPETENPYCDMQSSQRRSKDSAGQKSP